MQRFLCFSLPLTACGSCPPCYYSLGTSAGEWDIPGTEVVSGILHFTLPAVLLKRQQLLYVVFIDASSVARPSNQRGIAGNLPAVRH